jgi:hypothetical protein
MFTKTTKALVAAFVLASASMPFLAGASAGPTKAPSPDELNWMNRASNPNTNGF